MWQELKCIQIKHDRRLEIIHQRYIQLSDKQQYDTYNLEVIDVQQPDAVNSKYDRLWFDRRYRLGYIKPDGSYVEVQKLTFSKMLNLTFHPHNLLLAVTDQRYIVYQFDWSKKRYIYLHQLSRKYHESSYPEYQLRLIDTHLYMFHPEIKHQYLLDYDLTTKEVKIWTDQIGEFKLNYFEWSLDGQWLAHNTGAKIIILHLPTLRMGGLIGSHSFSMTLRWTTHNCLKIFDNFHHNYSLYNPVDGSRQIINTKPGSYILNWFQSYGDDIILYADKEVNIVNNAQILTFKNLEIGCYLGRVTARLVQSHYGPLLILQKEVNALSLYLYAPFNYRLLKFYRRFKRMRKKIELVLLINIQRNLLPPELMIHIVEYCF